MARQRPTKEYVDADVQVKTGDGKLWAVVVVGGSAATLIEFYDALSATGDPIFTASAPANQTSPLIDLEQLDGVPFNTGLYADITTTGGAVHVWYE